MICDVICDKVNAEMILRAKYVILCCMIVNLEWAYMPSDLERSDFYVWAYGLSGHMG